MTTEITAVQFYWRPGCPFCVALRRKLQRAGIPMHQVNIWEDAAAAARVRSVAGGNETVPTVFIGEHAVVNPSIGQVHGLLRVAAPGLLDNPAATRTRRRSWPFR